MATFACDDARGAQYTVRACTTESAHPTVQLSVHRGPIAADRGATEIQGAHPRKPKGNRPPRAAIEIARLTKWLNRLGKPKRIPRPASSTPPTRSSFGAA